MAMTPGLQEQGFDPNAPEPEKQIVDSGTAFRAANSLLRSKIGELTATVETHSNPSPGAARFSPEALKDYQAELAELVAVQTNLTAGRQPETASWFGTKARAFGKESELARQEAEKHRSDPDYATLQNIRAAIDNTLRGTAFDKTQEPGLRKALEIVSSQVSHTLCGEAQNLCNNSAKQAAIYEAIAVNLVKQ